MVSQLVLLTGREVCSRQKPQRVQQCQRFVTLTSSACPTDRSRWGQQNCAMKKVKPIRQFVTFQAQDFRRFLNERLSRVVLWLKMNHHCQQPGKLEWIRSVEYSTSTMIKGRQAGSVQQTLAFFPADRISIVNNSIVVINRSGGPFTVATEVHRVKISRPPLTQGNSRTMSNTTTSSPILIQRLWWFAGLTFTRFCTRIRKRSTFTTASRHSSTWQTEYDVIRHCFYAISTTAI